MNPNDVQLPNQRSVKGQVRSVGLAAAARRCAAVFEVGMAAGDFVSGADGVWDGERDILLGVHKVYLSQKALHRIEDKLRAAETEEQKRYRMRDAEVEGGLRIYNDPYSLYSSSTRACRRGPAAAGAMASPSTTRPRRSPSSRMHSRSSARSSTRARTTAMTCSGRCTARTRTLTPAVNADYTSDLGSESYTPSRNMFGAGDGGRAGDRDGRWKEEDERGKDKRVVVEVRV
ncbi:hypothetical protein B0H11DRAFT_2257920 [Mycena galericulata]|nr:hypothetical protein B0H11DRAFT_2257920 [Mycena galericulata]